MTDQKQDKTVDVRFSLITQPDRIGWPMHGALAIYDEEGGVTNVSPPFFSVDTGRELLRNAVADGRFDGDVATNLENQTRRAGLPADRTRYDRLITTFGFDKSVRHLIAHFSGAVPPTKGSGPARFEKCADGKYCGCTNCGCYEAHGTFVPEKVDARFGSLAFSSAQALATLMEGVEAGVFVPNDEVHLTTQISQAGLAGGQDITCADKVAALCPEDLGDCLDNAFGLSTIEKPARFEMCSCGGAHVNLFAFNERTIGGNAHTRYEAEILLKKGLDCGLIMPGAQQRLVGELDAIRLPPGSKEDSRDNQPPLITLIAIGFAGGQGS